MDEVGSWRNAGECGLGQGGVAGGSVVVAAVVGSFRDGSSGSVGPVIVGVNATMLGTVGRECWYWCVSNWCCCEGNWCWCELN